MLGSFVLETAIGLTALYLLVALATTVLQEFVASALKLRGRVLRTGLIELLSGQPFRGLGWLKQLGKSWQHVNTGQSFPVKVLRHPLVTSGTVYPSYVSSPAVAIAMIDVAARDWEVPATYHSLHYAVQTPRSHIEHLLHPLLDEPQGTLPDVQDRLGKWVDVGLDRVTGQYKRLSGWMSLIIATALAFLFQLNTFAFARFLWQDAQERVNYDLIKRNLDLLKALRIEQKDAYASLNLLDKILLWSNNSLGHLNTVIKNMLNDSIEKSSELVGHSHNLFEKLSSVNAADVLRYFSNFCAHIHYGSFWLGCAITAAAAAFAAPVWFDLLQKLINFRGAGGESAKAGPATIAAGAFGSAMTGAVPLIATATVAATVAVTGTLALSPNATVRLDPNTVRLESSTVHLDPQDIGALRSVLETRLGSVNNAGTLTPGNFVTFASATLKDQRPVYFDSFSGLADGLKLPQSANNFLSPTSLDNILKRLTEIRDNLVLISPQVTGRGSERLSR